MVRVSKKWPQSKSPRVPLKPTSLFTSSTRSINASRWTLLGGPANIRVSPHKELSPKQIAFSQEILQGEGVSKRLDKTSLEVGKGNTETHLTLLVDGLRSGKIGRTSSNCLTRSRPTSPKVFPVTRLTPIVSLFCASDDREAPGSKKSKQGSSLWHKRGPLPGLSSSSSSSGTECISKCLADATPAVQGCRAANSSPPSSGTESISKCLADATPAVQGCRAANSSPPSSGTESISKCLADATPAVQGCRAANSSPPTSAISSSLLPSCLLLWGPCPPWDPGSSHLSPCLFQAGHLGEWTTTSSCCLHKTLGLHFSTPPGNWEVDSLGGEALDAEL